MWRWGCLVGSKTKSSGCPLYLQAGTGRCCPGKFPPDPEGSIFELFAWYRWKREWDRVCVCLLAQDWGGTGVALPQGMLKPGCYSWCVLGCGAVVQAAAGRELGGCCTARCASRSRSCMAAFSRSVHGGERLRLHLI